MKNKIIKTGYGVDENTAYKCKTCGKTMRLIDGDKIYKYTAESKNSKYYFCSKKCGVNHSRIQITKELLK